MTPAPNTFLVGAAKAATTTLCDSLRAADGVFVCTPKEPNFFVAGGRRPAFVGPGDEDAVNASTVWRAHDYAALFAEAGGHPIRCDGSTWNLYWPEAPARIAAACPEAKVVVSLRDPVERAYSAFLHLRMRRREPLADFAAALRAEPERVAAGWSPIWHYAAMGFYGDQLRRYLAAFGERRVHVVLFEEFVEDPVATLDGLCRFLGVSPEGIAPAPQANATGLPRNRAAAVLGRPRPALGAVGRRVLGDSGYTRLRGWLRRAGQYRPPLDPATADALRARYAADAAVVRGLVGPRVDRWTHGPG